MRILKRYAILILMLACIISILVIPAYATSAEISKNVNVTTIKGDLTLTSVPKGSSTILLTDLWKVSIYVYTSDDYPVGTNGQFDESAADINKLAKFGYSIYISNSNSTYRGMATYGNVLTDKLDAIKSRLNGNDYAPSYQSPDGGYYQFSSSNGKLISDSSYPCWYVNDNISSEDAESFFGDLSNIPNLINAVAKQYGTGSTVNDKINSLLNKIDFDFKDANGNPIEINYRHVKPGDSNNYYCVPIVVIFEPAFYYNENPENLVPNGNKMIALTATDAILTEKKSGASGYLSQVRFLSNTKKYMRFYCESCNQSWYSSKGDDKEYIRCVRAQYYVDMLRNSGLTMDGASIDDMAEIFNCTSSIALNGFEKRLKSLKTSAWYPFSIISGPKLLARMSISSNKDSWFGGVIASAPAEAETAWNQWLMQSGEDKLTIRYGGYGVASFSKVKEEKDIVILEIKAVDSNLNSISGLKVLAGISPNQGEEVIASNYSRMTMGMSENSPEFLAIKKFYESIKAITSGSSWKNLLQVAAQTAENYIPLAFDISKMGISESDISAFGLNRMRNIFSGIEAFVAISKNDIPPEIEGKVYLYNDDLISKYKEISAELKNGNTVSSLISEYSNLVLKIENGYIKYFEGDMEGKDKNPKLITLDDGTIIKIASSLSPIIPNIGDTSWIALIGDNANLYNIGRIYLSEEENAKASILIPAILCDKIEIEEENANQDIIIGGDTSKIMLPNELIKGFTFESNLNQGISVYEEMPITDCPGWYEVEELETRTFTCRDCPEDKPEECTKCGGTGKYEKDILVTNRYDCEHSAHDIDNKISFDIDSVFIDESYFLNSSMLNGIDKLAVLRNGTAKNGVNFSFNTGSYTTNDINDIYSQITDYSFMSHRNANGTPLALASFMNYTNANKAFKSFISNYYSNYPESYNSQNGSFGANAIQIDTSISAPDDAAISGTLDACSGDSAHHNNINAGEVSSNFTTSSTIEVLPMYVAKNNSNEKVTLKSEYIDKDSFHFRLPSNSFEFTPAVGMTWYDSTDNSNPQNVWVLANTKHTFNGTDYVSIDIKAESSVSGAWSRDKADLERSKSDKMGTLKAGGTLTASGSAKVIVNAYIHLMDPSFCGASNSNSEEFIEAQNRNNAIIKEYDDYVISIISQLQNGGTNFYSNLYGATSPNTIHGNKNLPYGWEDLSEKTQFKMGNIIINSSTVSNSIYYVSNGLAPQKSNRQITIGNKNYAINQQWQDTQIIKSTARLNQLLNANEDYNYFENFDGLLILHRVYVIDLSTELDGYAQIHPRHSDGVYTTKLDELATDLNFAFKENEYIVSYYSGRNYVVGLELQADTGKTINNCIVPSFCLVGDPYRFHVLGTVYDQ